MSFKRKMLIGIAAVMATTVVGCSDFINGKKAEKEELNFSNERLACLKDVPPGLKKFSVGDAVESDIRGNVDCMREALVYFQKKTYGAQGNAYTVEEMRRFFSKYFLKENVVTPEFAQELMKIKKALLGGSSTNLTKEEITRLVDVLAIVRDESVQLAPHIKVLLNQMPNKEASWDQVAGATEQLRVSLQRLLDKTELAKSEYTFEDAKNALAGFKEFIRGSEPFAPYDQYSEWIPVVESVKNILMGREAQIVNSRQWKNSLNSLIDLYGLVLKYHYVIHNFDTGSEDKVNEVSQFIGQALDLIENCHQMTTKGMIPLEDIDALINSVLPKLNLGIRSKSIEKLYRAAILRLLDVNRQGDSRGIVGLEKKHLISLRREYNVWRMNQRFIDFESKRLGSAMSKDNLLKGYAGFKVNYLIESELTTDPYEEKALQNAWEDLGALLNSPIMLVYNDHGRIQEFDNNHSIQPTWKSLTKSNVMRALARGLMLAYGEKTSGVMADARMSKEGLVAWYDDFMDFMLDLKAFDPRSGNSGERSFMEANFFTFSGNGDDWMDQHEAYEFVSLLFSAGLSSSGNVVSDAVGTASCGVQQLDVFGYSYMDEACFKLQLRRNFSNYFDNLPEVARYVANLDDKGWDEFYGALKYVSATADQRPGLIETANVRTMVTILHYVESIMVVYDENRNQGLSLSEVYAAAPRFMSFLKDEKKSKISIKNETILKEGFAYLVFKGAKPSVTDLAGFQVNKMWLGEATRSDLMRAMKVIKDDLNNGKN